MTNEEFEQKLDALASTGKITEIIDDAMTAGVNNLYADMSNRIFNENQTITGASFGTYESDRYKEMRASIGLQTGKKDLQAFGNLRASMKPNYEKRAIVVEDSIRVRSIPYTRKDGSKGKTYTANPFNVMSGQEQQIVGTPGRGIFEASEAEVKDAVKIMEKIWVTEIKNALGII